MGVKQIIPVTFPAASNGSDIQYEVFAQLEPGFHGWASATSRPDGFDQAFPWPATGTFRNFVVSTDVAPGVGKTCTYTVRKNGVDTALTVTLSGTQTTGSDLTHSVAVALGDHLVLKKNGNGTTPTFGTIFQYVVEFDGDNAGESVYGTQISRGSTWTSPAYYSWMGNGRYTSSSTLATVVSTAAYNSVDSPYYSNEVCTFAGALTHYEAYRVTSAGTDTLAGPGVGKSLTFQIIKNGVVQDGTGGTVNTTATISGTNTTTTWTGSLPVAVGDILRLLIVPAGSPAGSFLGFGFCLTANTDGDFQMCFSRFGMALSGTFYAMGGLSDAATAPNWNASESIRQQITGPTPFWINSLVGSIAPDAPANPKSFNIRLNQAATPVVLNNANIHNTAHCWSVWAKCSSVSGALQIPSGATWGIQATDTPFSPPTPAPDYPCQVKTPIYFGAIQDRNNNIIVFSKKPQRDGSLYIAPGWKPPRLASLSTMNWAVSDFLTGAWSAQTASAKIIDFDHSIRNAAQPSYIGSKLWLYLTSEASRLTANLGTAGFDPTLMFHGPIYNDPLTGRLTYEPVANDYISAGFDLFKSDLMIPQRTIGADFPNRPQASDGLGVPIVGGPVSTSNGAIKLIDVGNLTVGGNTYAVGMVSGHACAGGVQAAYQNGALVSSWGTNFYAPGQAGWTTVQPSGLLKFTINGHDYTLVFMTGTPATNFQNGTWPVYVNVNGIEPTALGTGSYVARLLQQIPYVIEQFILQNYLGGSWLPASTFPFWPGGAATYPVLDLVSIAAADTQSAVYLGGGFLGGFVIGANGVRKSVRDVIKDINLSSNCFMYINEQRQIAMKMFDTTRASFLGAGQRILSDRRDALGNPAFTMDNKPDWFANDLKYYAIPNYRQDGTGDWNYNNIQGLAPSKATFGDTPGERRYALIRDTATADAVAFQHLNFGGISPPRIVTWAQSLCGMANPLATGARITDYGGSGGQGWVDNAVIVLSRSLDPSTGATTFTGMDVQNRVT